MKTEDTTVSQENLPRAPFLLRFAFGTWAVVSCLITGFPLIAGEFWWLLAVGMGMICLGWGFKMMIDKRYPAEKDRDSWLDHLSI